MPSLADQARAAHIVTRANNVIALDALWTGGLARGRPEEAEALGMVGDQLTTALADMRQAAPFLIEAAGELSDEDFDRPLSQPGVPADLVAAIRRQAEPRGGIAELTRQRVATLDDALASKQQAVAAETERLRSGAPPGVSGGSDADACAIGAAVGLAGALLGSPSLMLGGSVLGILSC